MTGSTSNYRPASSARRSPKGPILRRRAEGVRAVTSPSLVPFSRLMIVAALLGAFIAATLLFGFPAPAHAAGEVYVSNTGQNNSLQAQVGTTTRAQQFTTGGGAVGFYLGSIDLDVTRVPGSGTLKVTVRKVTASGNPGDIVYRLTNPASIGTGIHNFQAPEGAWLAANTNYFVRLAHDGASVGNEPRFRLTSDDNEDSGAHSGWDIADQHRLRLTSGTWTSYTDPLKISVKGPAVDPPAPAVPTNLSAVAGNGQVTLTWDNPENISIRKYQYSTDGGTTFNHMNGSGQNTDSFTFTGLTNGIEYTLAIRASNLSDEGAAATVTATPRYPAPANLVATPGDRKLTLNWTNPGVPGITNYVYRVGTDSSRVMPGSNANTTSYTITGLGAGTTYTVRLFFQDQNGHSETAMVTATTLWSKPTNLVAAPDNGRVVLEWDRGDSGITNYLVRSGVAGGTDDPSETLVPASSGTKTTVELTALTNGTEYTFSVRAVEVSGGEYVITGVSSTVNETPAVALPAAPTGLAATPGSGQVELSWDNPGNITITEYQYSTDGGTTFIQIPGSGRHTTTYTITGLSGDTLYTFAIRAKNFSGGGTASTVSFELYTGSVLVSNIGKETNHQSEISNAFAQKFTTGESAAGYYLSSLKLVVSLAPGAGTLTVTVRSKSVYGGPSDTILYTLTNPSNVGTGLQTFTAPSSAYLNPNTEYFVQMSYSGNGARPRWALTTSPGEDSVPYPGWSIANTHRFRTGSNWNITLWSVKIAVNTVPAPTNLVTAPDDGQVVLQWDTGDATISHYLVRSKTLGGSDDPSYTLVPAGSGNRTAGEVTGLTNGTEYIFAVMAAAVSGSVTKGLGAHVSVTETPVALPSAPTGLAATPGNGQVELSWDNPGNITITEYQYSTDGGTIFTQIRGSGRDTTAYTITGLSGDTQYTFAIRAKNLYGEGPASTVSFELYAGTVLVSNTGQSADADTFDTLSGVFAQKFTTGGNAAGYYLASITWRVSTAPGNGNLTATVRTDDGTGYPSGTALYTLTNPSNVGTGLQTFTAPGNAFLDPETDYFVQMSYSGGGTRPRWKVTNSNGEDSVSHPGWSIADTHRYRNGGFWHIDNQPIQIGVNTTPAPTNVVATPDNQRVVLQWDTGGAGISHYLVSSKTLHSTDDPSYTLVPAGSGNRTAGEVTGLTNGTEYIFAVMAAAVSGSVTKGLGVQASVTETPAVVPPPPAPAAPTGLTATPGDGQVILDWDLDITVNKYQTLTVPEIKLAPSGGADQDYFGISVAMDNDTMVVGASRDDDGATNSGSAYVYTRNGSGTWSQQAKLNASDASENDRFGISVAVDGDTAVVGAYNEGTSANKPGAAYVFNRNASDVWSQAAKLTASDRATDDQFGYSVALHGDTAIIGAHRDDNANGVKAGAVYVFTKQSGSFTTSTETQKLTASDGAAGDEFGISIALEDNTAVIGAYRDDGNIGSAYIFTKDSLGVWNQVAKLTSSDRQIYDLFGGSVALDGDTVAVGAFTRDEGGWFGSGAVYIFTKPQGGWADSTETAKLTAYDAQPTNWFGLSVEVDGDRLWVGASGSDAQFDSDGRGSIYFFTKPASGWAGIDINSAAKLMASDGTANDRFGFSIAGDGDTIATGAWLGDGAASGSGAAYILEIPEWADIPGSGFTTASHPVTGLTNGQQYTFAVRGENNSGSGPASTVSAKPSS